MLDTQKIIAEEIAALQEEREKAFRAKISAKLRNIAAVQTEIAKLQKALDAEKAELKQLTFDPLDGASFQ